MPFRLNWWMAFGTRVALTLSPSYFSIALHEQQFFLFPIHVLARGVSDGVFGRMVALPLAIRQSQCGIGTSGTPIFFSRPASAWLSMQAAPL